MGDRPLAPRPASRPRLPRHRCRARGATRAAPRPGRAGAGGRGEPRCRQPPRSRDCGRAESAAANAQAEAAAPGGAGGAAAAMGLLNFTREPVPEAVSGDMQNLNQLSAQVGRAGPGEGAAAGAAPARGPAGLQGSRSHRAAGPQQPRSAPQLRSSPGSGPGQALHPQSSPGQAPRHRCQSPAGSQPVLDGNGIFWCLGRARSRRRSPAPTEPVFGPQGTQGAGGARSRAVGPAEHCRLTGTVQRSGCDCHPSSLPSRPAAHTCARSPTPHGQLRKPKPATRPLTSSFPFSSWSGYPLGLVKHENRYLRLFPLTVFGLHRIEQQLPISRESQKPCAVPATSCTNPLRVLKNIHEEIPSTGIS